MTDYEKTKVLFDALKIPYADSVGKKIKSLTLSVDKKKVQGYTDFFTTFDFDADNETFISVGIWE